MPKGDLAMSSQQHQQPQVKSSDSVTVRKFKNEMRESFDFLRKKA